MAQVSTAPSGPVWIGRISHFAMETLPWASPSFLSGWYHRVGWSLSPVRLFTILRLTTRFPGFGPQLNLLLRRFAVAPSVGILHWKMSLWLSTRNRAAN